MEKYNHKDIEAKWQKKWRDEGTGKAEEGSTKEKYYLLIEFPYPSAEGLHVGHVRSYTALDIIARKKRAEGLNVLYPIGWDAFGLPTENYAIKTGIHPKVVTKNNTDNFRKQLQELGFSFDWSREINTTDPSYYKWTQWIFLQFYKKGLAYKAKARINWCLSCKVGLANEEVVDGVCERCGGEIEKKEKEQWMLAITKYADRLDSDLDTVDYLERIKTQQRNWIGRSIGHEVTFPIENNDQKIAVFTTRIDTLFGATYMVLSPEHPLVYKLENKIENFSEVKEYVSKTTKKTEIERLDEGKKKTGVELKGIKAINPANQEKIPVFIADYVLPHYGTGAIMAVPAHDERDYEFAKKFKLPITQVIESPKEGRSDEVYTGLGVLIKSGEFNGLESTQAKGKIANFVSSKEVTTYKLRDWVFSRQRYWGEPIPMIYCEKCKWVPVPEEELPVELPEVEKYQTTDTGESPLASFDEWVITICPKCHGEARRETDTMPQWAGSSWYYLRYCDPQNDTAPASQVALKYWTPVDWYNGGMEHTTLHLLYSRFWHKFLFDIGVVPTSEPYKKRTSHGFILAEGGLKMSKSKGNVINPSDVSKNVGADTLRVYEMFTGPFDQSFVWSTDNMVGIRRFLERVWRTSESLSDPVPSKDLLILLNQTIKKVGEDIESLKFNTAVSQLMILHNKLESLDSIPKDVYKIFIKLLSPFAPHISEELWEFLGGKNSVHLEDWPVYDVDLLSEANVTIAVQVNGKVRGEVVVGIETTEEEVKERVLQLPLIAKWLEGATVEKVIYVPHKILNLVVK